MEAFPLEVADPDPVTISAGQERSLYLILVLFVEQNYSGRSKVSTPSKMNSFLVSATHTRFSLSI